MGKPHKSLFRTLISTAKSLHKEKRDQSDSVRKPRKVPKDRCMWSLGKSSWRSREAVDMVEEEGEKKEEVEINGSKQAMEAVHVEEGKGSKEKLEQIQEEGSEQARETVEQDPEPEAYIVRKVEGVVDEEGAGRGVQEEEAGEEVYEKECEIINTVENVVEQGEVDGKDFVIVVSGRESAVQDDEQEPVEQNESGNGGFGGDEAVLDEEDDEEHEGLEEEETEEHEGLDEEENEEHEGLDEEELGLDRDEFEVGAEELGQDVEESDKHEVLVTEEAAEPSLRMIQASLKIQAAFLGYLARRTYLQAMKGLVKLQALVRGRNARRAMARQRYVYALVKVQSLVRGHLVRKSDLGLLVQTHLNNRSNHLSIEPQLGLARNNTITINEVDVQQCDELVSYTVGNGRKTGHVFKQDEELDEAHAYHEDDASGSEKKGTGMACHQPCETILPDMSFPMKDEDQCSEHFSPMKELEECSQLALLVKEEDEVGITSGFSSSLSSILMPSPSSSSTSALSTPSSSSSPPSPNTTLEDISTGRTSPTTQLTEDNNQSIKEDRIGVSDPEDVMCERPRSFVFHNDEHIEEKSLCASDINGSYPDAMESGIIEQISSLVMVSKTEERDSRSVSLKQIGEATNELLGNAMFSQQEQISPSLSLIIPNYMSMTKSSNAKKVIGSPKLKKSEAVRSRGNSPNPKQASPKLRRDHPQSRLDSPNLKIDSAKSGLDTCKPRLDSPKTKTDSPKLRLDSPKPRLDSPNVRLNSPKHRRADLSSHEQDPLRMTRDSLNLVKLDPYSVKRRHSLSGLEAKSGFALVAAREVL